MKPIQDRNFSICLRFAAVLLIGVVGTNGTAQERETSGLEAVFSPGLILQDRNGDEVINFVDATIVVGESPTVSDIAAAADVAARLGYETMAMDIPLASLEESSGPAILVGSAALTRAGVAATVVGLAGLASGEGIIQLLTAGGREWLVIAGADEAGTRAAAQAFAGRLPYLWEPNGTTLDEVVGEVREFLTDQGAEAGSMRIPTVRVKEGSNSLESLVVEARLGSADQAEQVQSALEALARDRGEAAASDEPPLSYPGARVLRVVLSAPGVEQREVVVPQAEPDSKGGPIPARPGSAGKRELGLSNLFTPKGLLGDSDNNQIPDRVDAMLSPFGSGTEGTVDLAARLGLESAGISIPMARIPEEIESPTEQPTLILIGHEHPLIDELVEDGKLELGSLEPDQGLIQVLPKAFGEKGALVITGGDETGVSRALEQVAERLPNLWERGKDHTTIDDIENDVWHFLSGRSPAGQAAIALYKLDRIVAGLSEKVLASAQVLVSVEKPADGLEEMIRERASAIGADSLEVIIDNRDVQNAKVIFDDAFEIPSEVDEFWNIFRSRVLPKVQRGKAVEMEVRLSEPPEIRARIEEQARAELVKKGASETDTRVKVLSAYKQGFSWLTEVVGPAVSDKSVEQLTIQFAENVAPDEWKQQAIQTPIRWLHEIFPIDEILARDWKIDLASSRFEMMPPDSPTYQVIATGPGGAEVFRQTFEPHYVLRPYFDRFRDYEMVRVTTGWITATTDGNTLVNQRIPTDAEKFWDHYQQNTLPSIYDYVMERHEGNPRGGGQDAPLFGELTVELSLSEPHYLLGLDKELIAPMDSLHEEIYFTTIEFFHLLGRNARGEEIIYPGRIIPIMHPKSDGDSGTAKITFTGFATHRPAVVVDFVERSGRSDKVRLDVPKIVMDRPKALGALVRDGRPGLERLDVRVKVDTETDERDELVLRASEERVDEQILSAEQVTAVLANLSRLRARGMYREALAYTDLGGLRIAAGWEHEVDPESQLVAALEPNGSPAPYPDIKDRLPAGYRYDGGSIVQWDTPIPPPEAYDILAKMSTFEEASVYKVGKSYLGKEIWAMDLMPPIEASHWSHAKATTLKPTVIYSAREHANEVSSTSHVLKLAERLLTEPEYQQKLNKVNVVIHPITNADGAQLAYDLYKITPELILHAGYLASLGMGSSSGSREPIPIYPESKVRPRLWATWLPDIFLNPHGYPSHQVVQLFSEYTGLVRRGRVTERNWSMNKGWFIPSFNYLDDPRYPRHKEAAFKIRDYITEAINAAPDVYALNQRNYDRFRRYGAQFDGKDFKLDMTDDVLIYMPLKGARAPSPDSGASRPGRPGYNPKVTIWSGGTEAPDETAHGDWMKLVATAGLQWDTAILNYLVDGNHKVERKGKTFWGGVSLSMDRPRPPKPEPTVDSDGDQQR